MTQQQQQPPVPASEAPQGPSDTPPHLASPPGAGPHPPHARPFDPLPDVDARPADGGWAPRGRTPETAFPVPWQWWDGPIAYTASLAAAILLGVPLAFFVPMGLLEGILVSASSALLAVAVPGWIATRRLGGARALWGPVRPHGVDALLGVVAGLTGFVVLNIGLSALLQFLYDLIGAPLPPIQEELQQLARDPVTMPWVLVAVVVFAPLGEELLFRGLLFQRLRRQAGLWPAAVGSGLVFGLAHSQSALALLLAAVVLALLAQLLRRPLATALQRPVVRGVAVAVVVAVLSAVSTADGSGPIPIAVVVTGAFGVGLALLFHRRGTLLAPVLAHSAFNAVTIVLVVAGPG